MATRNSKAPGSAFPSWGASFSGTADASGPKGKLTKAPPSPSPCRSNRQGLAQRNDLIVAQRLLPFTCLGFVQHHRLVRLVRVVSALSVPIPPGHGVAKRVAPGISRLFFLLAFL